MRPLRFRCRLVPLILCLLLLCPALTAQLPGQRAHWFRFSSKHFTITDNSDESKARVTILPFEQMRATFSGLLAGKRVNLPTPMMIVAFRSQQQFQNNAPGASKALYITGPDRDFVLLDGTNPESWRQLVRPLGRTMLNANYPPAQPWFDEGFIEYFASLEMDKTSLHLGGVPSPLGAPAGVSPAGYVAALAGNWIPLAELFTMQPSARPELFYAESWIVMHYLINNDKLSETGNYLYLVKTKKIPANDAIAQAYGVSAVQFERTIKDYYQKIAPTFVVNRDHPLSGPLKAETLPISLDEMGGSLEDLSDPEGAAEIAEMELRIASRREEAIQQLQKLVADPKMETAAAHRALGWNLLQKPDYNGAFGEFDKALALDVKDLWTRYYISLAKYEAARAGGQEIHGLANMLQDLKLVVDWYPDFARAYDLLAMARLEGGGVTSAMEAIKAATLLAPRNDSYVFDLAKVYISAKQWDAATALLNHLTESPDAQVAAAAKAELADLPSIRKYGITPQASARTSMPEKKPPERQRLQAHAEAPPPAQPAQDNSEEDHETTEDKPPAPPPVDRRPVAFMKGKLIGVDCSASPAAVITVMQGRTAMQFRTADYHSLVLVGADKFSCDWSCKNVSVNYKEHGAVGDLVSLEVQ